MMEPVHSSVLMKLIAVCRLKPFELGDSLCLGDEENAAANRAGFGADVTGFEAFVNHVHLGDLWEKRGTASPSIELLQATARIVLACWAVSLLPLLRKRCAVFIAGGTTTDDFSLRFHVERGKHESWVDLEDTAFLTSNHLAVWRFSTNGLEVVHEW